MRRPQLGQQAPPTAAVLAKGGARFISSQIKIKINFHPCELVSLHKTLNLTFQPRARIGLLKPGAMIAVAGIGKKLGMTRFDLRLAADAFRFHPQAKPKPGRAHFIGKRRHVSIK